MSRRAPGYSSSGTRTRDRHRPRWARAIDWGVYGAPESFLVNPAVRCREVVGAMTPEIWPAEISAAPGCHRVRIMNARVLAVALGAWLWAAPLLAIDLTPPLADPSSSRLRHTDPRAALHECQNETLADSTVSLAADLRLEVTTCWHRARAMMNVRDYLVSRYGDFILFRPDELAHAWLVGAAGLLLLAGAVAASACCSRARACSKRYRADRFGSDPK